MRPKKVVRKYFFQNKNLTTRVIKIKFILRKNQAKYRIRIPLSILVRIALKKQREKINHVSSLEICKLRVVGLATLTTILTAEF